MSEETPAEKVLTIPHPDAAEYNKVEGSSTFQILSLRGDVIKEAGTFMSRMSPGAIAPWHWHTPIEEFICVKGTVVAQLKGGEPVVLGPGGYTQLPAKHIHRFRCTEGSECIVFVVSAGAYDLHWVDGDGKEIDEKEATRLSDIVGTTDW